MKLMNIKNVLLILSAMISVSAYSADMKLDPIKGKEITYDAGYRYSLNSNVLSEQRELLIHLPKGYEESDKKYPVIYLLDGNGHFRHATTSITYLQSNNLMPEVIIVGITNQPGKRNRDLGEGSEKFWSYIKSEVASVVEKNYRTSGHKTIFGHSMAGAFVMEGFLDDHSWFDSYIAASPGMEMELFDKYTEYFSHKNTQLKNIQEQSFFFSMAGIPAEGKENVDIATNLDILFKRKAPDNFNWGYRFLPQQVHMTTPSLTFYEGITQTFFDYQAPAISSYQEYMKLGGMKGLEQHYQKLAIKYQTKPGVPDQTVRRLANVVFDDGHKDEAIKMLITNTQKFPESFRAFIFLARIYEQNKQAEESLTSFKKALVLAKQQNSRGVGYIEGEIKRMTK